MKFLVVETPCGGGLDPTAAVHPQPHVDRWPCLGDQRVEACYAFRDQPGGLYIIEAGTEEELTELIGRGPVVEGAVREVHVLRDA